MHARRDGACTALLLRIRGPRTHAPSQRKEEREARHEEEAAAARCSRPAERRGRRSRGDGRRGYMLPELRRAGEAVRPSRSTRPGLPPTPLPAAPARHAVELLVPPPRGPRHLVGAAAPEPQDSTPAA
ncbi:unnamed protein product [Urochloa humidicola]